MASGQCASIHDTRLCATAIPKRPDENLTGSSPSDRPRNVVDRGMPFLKARNSWNVVLLSNIRLSSGWLVDCDAHHGIPVRSAGITRHAD